MLIPTKHEKLERNTLVLGADLLSIVKNGINNIEDLFQALKSKKNISLEEFYNTVVFLWISDLIAVSKYTIDIRK